MPAADRRRNDVPHASGLTRPAAAGGALPAGRQRSTRQGDAVDAALRASDGFLTAQDLHADMRRRGDRIGLTTVYRHLKMLVDAGAVDVVHRADGEAQYRLCGPRDPGGRADPVDHHHHLVCRVCGRAVEVAGPQVERWAEEVAAEHGYTEITHTLEVFGLCAEHSASSSLRPRSDRSSRLRRRPSKGSA